MYGRYGLALTHIHIYSLIIDLNKHFILESTCFCIKTRDSNLEYPFIYRQEAVQCGIYEICLPPCAIMYHHHHQQHHNHQHHQDKQRHLLQPHHRHFYLPRLRSWLLINYPVSKHSLYTNNFVVPFPNFSRAHINYEKMESNNVFFVRNPNAS